MAAKDDALKVHSDAVVAADGALYDVAYTNGVTDGKAAGGGFTQADIDKAVAADKAAMQPQIDDLTKQVQALQADDDAKTKVIAGIMALLQPAQPSQTVTPAPSSPASGASAPSTGTVTP